MSGERSPRAYVLVTGALFGLLALAHLARTFSEWRRLGTEPGFWVEGPGIAVIAAVLALWAWRLGPRPPRR
jgi:hypothetical protein